VDHAEGDAEETLAALPALTGKPRADPRRLEEHLSFLEELQRQHSM